MADTFLETESSSSFSPDPVIEAYKKDVDRTLLRENLKLTVDERFKRFESFMRGVYELRGSARSATWDRKE